MRGSHGWAEISRERKREIIEAIAANRPTRGPVHVELDLTDRCNVDCYFCNQRDVRTKDSIPLPRLNTLIDELVATGLRSVRLSGGGDPLFHKDILPVLDHLASSDVVVDNLTTNAVALTEEIAERLVRNRAREVIVSLNATDAADYARMMRVKPALFDKVLENVRRLLQMRGDSIYPSVVLQFLIDRHNLDRLVDMYELGASIGPDRIALNAVLEIPYERIDDAILLKEADRERAEPLIEEILLRDRETGLLQIDFAIPGWNAMLWRVRDRVGSQPHNSLPTSPSFRDENGGCFFGWYTAAVTGTGDIRPCCLMLHPDIEPLGNIHDGPFEKHWNGPEFGALRDEMREVMLLKGQQPYVPRRFEKLAEPCVTAGRCWLKNQYFRGDDEFYSELGQTLDAMRAKEVRWIGTPRQMSRRFRLFVFEHPSLNRAWDRFRESTRPLRIAIKRRLGLRLTDAG
ncbi:MAG: radical SAM protein [Thermoanaerobaculia bacterium]